MNQSKQLILVHITSSGNAYTSKVEKIVNLSGIDKPNEELLTIMNYFLGFLTQLHYDFDSMEEALSFIFENMENSIEALKIAYNEKEEDEDEEDDEEEEGETERKVTVKAVKGKSNISEFVVEEKKKVDDLERMTNDEHSIESFITQFNAEGNDDFRKRVFKVFLKDVLHGE